MKTFNNELVVQRGETFTMQKRFENKDGSPFIVSSELQNPALIITVTNATYSQKNRYVKNYYLPFDNAVLSIPRFYNTRPVDLTTLKYDATHYYTSFAELKQHMSEEASGLVFSVYDDAKGQALGWPTDECVFYMTVNGVKEYKYWKDNDFRPYQFVIAKMFSSDDTSEWVEQSYLYSITLAAGTDDERSAVRKTLLGPTKLSVLSNLRGGI